MPDKLNLCRIDAEGAPCLLATGHDGPCYSALMALDGADDEGDEDEVDVDDDEGDEPEDDG